MDIVIQNQANPGKVLLAFSSLADSDLSGLKFAVAYVTKAGSDCLFGIIKNKIGSTKWESIPKTVITSFDFGLTEPVALVSMQKIANCKVQISGKNVLQNKMLRPLYAYHPKMYIFEKNTTSSLAIGSANLSHSALTTNAEAISIYESFPDQDQLDQCWNQIIAQSEELSPSLLSLYTTVRKKYQFVKTKPELSGEKPDLPDPQIVPGSLDILNHPISIGKLSPMSYDHFWVQAGSMSSGGSANQLELPRGANLFFGYNFDNYTSYHQVIGYPTIFTAKNTWKDRPLTWHGHNSMERINLPTSAQGGFHYKDSIVHFTRYGKRFELLVFPFHHTISKIWRNMSKNNGLVFKLGTGSNRICGLY